MSAYPHSEIANEIGCRAVKNMAVIPGNRALLGREGCRAVVVAMKSFPTATVTEQGLMAMRSLCCDANNNFSLGTVGAVQAVISAINTFSSNELIVAHAATAIRSLSSDAANRILLSGGGGCAAVSLALRLYPRNPDVAEQALTAIISLGTDAPTRPLLAQAGCCQYAVECIKCFPTSEIVTLQGITALRNLATGNKENTTTLGKVGACDIGKSFCC